jgi:twitching motility protein PilT
MTMTTATSGLQLRQLLKLMVEKNASDLHVTKDAPPYLRVDGNVLPIKVPPLAASEVKRILYGILSEDQKIQFERTNELDFSFDEPGLSRFRANYYVQRGSMAAALRTIPFKILSCDELGLPPVVGGFADKPNGLVLVTGPTGSGKSTTLAAIIDKINAEQRCHILTIEDPIEFVHPNKLSVINQREVGSDTEGFKTALKYVLRQDPDVVLVGEMRDMETIEAALTISETGHLVFGTLHTNSAISTINRIIDVFPPHQQDQIRTKLSFVLQGVISQQLLPRAGQPGRCMAIEVMVPNPAIRNLMREGKIHQMYSQMQVGQDKYGMITLNQSLFNLLRRGLITQEEAFFRSMDAEELKTMVANAGMRLAANAPK